MSREEKSKAPWLAERVVALVAAFEAVEVQIDLAAFGVVMGWVAGREGEVGDPKMAMVWEPEDSDRTWAVGGVGVESDESRRGLREIEREGRRWDDGMALT